MCTGGEPFSSIQKRNSFLSINFFKSSILPLHSDATITIRVEVHIDVTNANNLSAMLSHYLGCKDGINGSRCRAP